MFVYVWNATTPQLPAHDDNRHGSPSAAFPDVDLHERGPIAIEARLHIQLGLGFKGAGFGVEGAGFGV